MLGAGQVVGDLRQVLVGRSLPRPVSGGHTAADSIPDRPQPFHLARPGWAVRLGGQHRPQLGHRRPDQLIQLLTIAGACSSVASSSVSRASASLSASSSPTVRLSGTDTGVRLPHQVAYPYTQATYGGTRSWGVDAPEQLLSRAQETRRFISDRHRSIDSNGIR